MDKGRLYIVATPIGNMGDITNRAVEILSAVDFVACEDTRVAGGLLYKLGIKKELVSIHQHSSEEKINLIIRYLESGHDVAYVSDNGTPGVSDPGSKLAARSMAQGARIIPIPGASAVTAAISVSGMIEKEFYFAGFLPKKKGRETKFKWLANLPVPIIIYESAQRLEKTLTEVKKYLGQDTDVFIAREMTKKFEEYWAGDISDIISDLKDRTIKGEFVIILKKKAGAS